MQTCGSAYSTDFSGTRGVISRAEVLSAIALRYGISAPYELPSAELQRSECAVHRSDSLYLYLPLVDGWDLSLPCGVC